MVKTNHVDFRTYSTPIPLPCHQNAWLLTLTVSSSSMSILKVCCCKVFKVISILSVEFYYSCVRFKRFKSNLHESLLFSLNHRKLSAAMTYRFSSSMLNTWRTALLLDCFGTAVNWALATMLRCARWWVFQHAWFQWSITMQKHCELIN